MDKDLYFQEMRSFSQVVWPYIEKGLQNVTDELEEVKSDRFNLIPAKRKNKPLLKPFLVKLAAETAGTARTDAISGVGAAAELLNISSYQFNSAFDEKNAILSPTDKDEQFIAGALTREAIPTLISGLNLRENTGRRIATLLRDANTSICQGQYLDMFVLTVDDTLELSKDDFKECYINRCDLLSGTFTRNCAIAGAELVDAEENIKTALGEFGRNLGIAMQIANDVGDLAPVDDFDKPKKPYQDQFSDFRNGRLTYPIYSLLKRCNTEKRDWILNWLVSGNNFKLENAQYISQLFVESGAFDASRKLAISYGKKAKRSLHKIDEQESIPFLSCMASIAKTNKYYHRLKQMSKSNAKGLLSYPST